jgi:hypothetical protein
MMPYPLESKKMTDIKEVTMAVVFRGLFWKAVEKKSAVERLRG